MSYKKSLSLQGLQKAFQENNRGAKILGTSKGYIPPKSAEWRRAKGAVTRMSGGNYDRENVGKAVSKFAEAYATTHLPNSNVGIVAGNVLNFIQSIHSSGVNQTLEAIGLSALLDKDGMELYNGIVDYFATDIASTDGQAIRDSLLETLKVLEIHTVDDFSQHNSSEFLTSFMIQFAISNFEHCFSEKILTNVDSIDRYNQLMEIVEQIIENTIVADVEIDNILQINFSSQEGLKYIQRICDDCFNALKAMGELHYEDLD